MVARTGVKLGVTWHLAPALGRLMDQVDDAWPRRATLSDGSIASTQHSLANPSSDHEVRRAPSGAYYVTAVDITTDPASGADMARVAAALVASRDPRIKYLIHQGRICDSRPEFHPWQWTTYSGPNRHDHHLHISVLMNRAGDTRPWHITGPATPPAGPILRRNDMAEVPQAQWDEVYRWVKATGPVLAELTRKVQATGGRLADVQREVGDDETNLTATITGVKSAILAELDAAGQPTGVWYVQQAGRAEIYEVISGRARHVTAAEWAARSLSGTPVVRLDPAEDAALLGQLGIPPAVAPTTEGI